MSSNKLGETKGPFIVWLFVTLCFAIPILLGSSSGGTLPQDITLSLILSLLINMAIPWGLVLLFLVIFLAFWEKKRSLKEIFSNLGLKREGSAKSLFWTLALIPFFLVIIFLLLMMFTYFLGPVSLPQTSGSGGGQAPFWYPYYMIIYSFFPVAVTEEIITRGYMLDRLMPEHPSTLTKASPAIIISSLLQTLYHIPAYLGVYQFSTVWAIALLVGNVFPWSIALGVAYVRARTRNILGPILIHFLADSMPVILLLA